MNLLTTDPGYSVKGVVKLDTLTHYLIARPVSPIFLCLQGLLKLGAALAPAIVAAQSAQLIMLPDSANADAVCLDGTPYGVYFYPGSGDGANKWLVYFQGGGCVAPSFNHSCTTSKR